MAKQPETPPDPAPDVTERKGIVDQAVSNNPKITEAERARRQEVVDYGRGTVRLEGFTLSPEMEELNRRYAAGEITLAELGETVRRKHGV